MDDRASEEVHSRDFVHHLMGYIQEAVQEGIGLNEIFVSDLQRMFTSIREQKALIDVNNEFAIYCNERFKKRPVFKRRGWDFTKGGSD